jgi:hypothetical protein
MRYVLVALILIGLLPLMLAVRANRETSLLHALIWAIIAWLGWGLAFFLSDSEQAALEPARFLALALTGCAGVAVLGARRPYVMAWNLVIAALLPVMVSPLVETLFIGTRSMDALRIFFLAATIAVGMLNYLPTRAGPAALVLLIAGSGQLAFIYAPLWLGAERVLIFDFMLGAAPWVAWLCYRQRNRVDLEFNRLWRSFRDRWGLVWGQRVREQFNNAVENAGLPVRLSWQGLVIDEGASLSTSDEVKILTTLRAVLQRFLEPERG